MGEMERTYMDIYSLYKRVGGLDSCLSLSFSILLIHLFKTNQVFLFLCYQSYSHFQSGSDSWSDNIGITQQIEEWLGQIYSRKWKRKC
jgi:hypothetical protein